MKLIGSWKTEEKAQYTKQVQTHLGELADQVDMIVEEQSLKKGYVLRDLWQWVLDSDLEVRMISLQRDVNGSERLTAVSVTEEMFNTIEEVRGTIPRGTFLRAITAAGIKAKRTEEQKEQDAKDAEEVCFAARGEGGE